MRKPVVWSADLPLTMGQLQGRRDTFWDTAPMYDGRREIWDALRAAVEAAEREEYDLAQAILSGANITLPTGEHLPIYITPLAGPFMSTQREQGDMLSTLLPPPFMCHSLLNRSPQ